MFRKETHTVLLSMIRFSLRTRLVYELFSSSVRSLNNREKRSKKQNTPQGVFCFLYEVLLRTKEVIYFFNCQPVPAPKAAT